VSKDAGKRMEKQDVQEHRVENNHNRMKIVHFGTPLTRI